MECYLACILMFVFMKISVECCFQIEFCLENTLGSEQAKCFISVLVSVVWNVLLNRSLCSDVTLLREKV